MAKNKISEFSATAADNTDITNINIAEGCSPANVNNAVRSLMSLLKNQQDGSSGDPFTVSGALTASGTFTSSGTIDITGGFQLDGSVGTSGQALVSAGANTPTWSTLGTMASQNATSVAITGGTITGITDLTVADGGTGASSITANSVILGNGASTLSGNLVAPSTSGNVLTSNGTTWTSTAPAGIGVGQTWTDVSGSRAVSTTYTNSTGKPILLSVQGTASVVGMYVIFTVGGVAIASGTAGGTSSGFAGANIIIPVGATYSFAPNTGSLTSLKVFELR
jgi:hypothetical protein